MISYARCSHGTCTSALWGRKRGPTEQHTTISSYQIGMFLPLHLPTPAAVSSPLLGTWCMCLLLVAASLHTTCRQVQHTYSCRTVSTLCQLHESCSMTKIWSGDRGCHMLLVEVLLRPPRAVFVVWHACCRMACLSHSPFQQGGLSSGLVATHHQGGHCEGSLCTSIPQLVDKSY